MTVKRRLSRVAVAALIMAGGLASTTSVQAEDLINFLWGGSEEYGGGRRVVSFDSKYKPGQIIVSFSDRRLYFITKQGEAITYPVAVPKGDARWQGVTSVTNKRVNPPWTPTPDMVRSNPRLPRWVPGGHPMNPLGIRALYLGSSTYRIHGTDAPWTIGQAVSSGCIRMTNQDVLDLYPRVPVGMRVTVTWQQFKTGSAISSKSYPRYGDDQAEKASSNSGYAQTMAPTRATYTQPQSNSNALFYSDDDAPPRTQRASVRSEEPSDSIYSGEGVDATIDEPIEQPAKKKTAAVSTQSEAKPVEPKKKKPAVVEKKSVSTPAPAHSRSVPDPVKPREAAPADPTPTKSSMVEHPAKSS
ncbi:ErfK/YbiS/YcfS/YnhG family protein [Hyphomicrobium denitrificans ATCC 51888]|uniref:ErfK/YbiS/YcfS/YnhG family protein n=1 Tax=Hyphomicrobium denitrificans (strain ATCC 51888 / DSM 1869 / NCIMB 11706 / TK 0415) TaxID=582899 RepID=D8JTE7_HYPDA|nr:L,D-transpeptidase [Hyphomicrobium denitrificans]ADJ24465.1 ErfK/YbiS/YcfS/YnhG family protein [Hyphomicrobium denitrificans ATCC 51888]